MKKLSTYLFLVLFSFQTSSLGDWKTLPLGADVDIRDYEIEGMSIGDSLLDYFSEEEIKDNIVIDPILKSKKFIRIQIFSQNFKVYDGVQFFYNRYDKKYKIHSITGYVDYDKNIDGCYRKQDELDKELSIIFKDAKRYEGSEKIIRTHQSTLKQIFYDFKSGSGVSISCYDSRSRKDSSDFLYVTLDSKEFMQWLSPGGCGYGSMCYNRY